MSTDFFVSYTGSDENWAEWVAYALEDAGFSTVIQKWDFRPGSNFVVEMQNASEAAERTIMILSPGYVKANFTTPEWAAAFVKDPKGLEKKLVPVQVMPCDLPGLLGPMVHIKLAGLEEPAARKALLEGVKTARAKPSSPPAFPGAGSAPMIKNFPGPSAASAATRTGYMPKLTRPATDADKRQLLRVTMDSVRDHFRIALAELEKASTGVTTDLEVVSTKELFAEIFLDGKSKQRCRVWQGGLTAENGISYAEGSTASISGGSNEILSVSSEGSEVFLRSLMAPVGFGIALDDLNLQRLSPEDTAEYLWRRFTSRLG